MHLLRGLLLLCGLLLLLCGLLQQGVSLRGLLLLAGLLQGVLQRRLLQLAGVLGGEPLRGLLHLHGRPLLQLELSFLPGDSRAICRWLRVLGFRVTPAAKVAAISARCGLPVQ
jgi:hypothetical protein